MENKELLDTLRAAIDGALSNLHTAIIARVTTVNASTINCQPVITRVVNGESVELPEFIEVPVLTMQGGGSYTAYPIAVDDYCLLILTERCFDRWYDGQDSQPPLELRMHDYSDGVAIVGLNPLSDAITIPLGNTIIEGDLDLNGDLTVTGNITATGEITALSGSPSTSVSLSTHVHTSAAPGVPTSPPTGGT